MNIKLSTLLPTALAFALTSPPLAAATAGGPEEPGRYVGTETADSSHEGGLSEMISSEAAHRSAGPTLPRKFHE
ncbi:MAG: hypothetical protein EXS38_00520 [Opitutus sp.]|nr:hypothetical protein [Opitutus sp.]